LLLLQTPARATDTPVPNATAPEETPLTEIIISAREPRFVAPTRRDEIGRIWAPVFINRQGPFRLVLDSGASHCAITRQVANLLGLPINANNNVMLRGVTGSLVVPTVHVESVSVGDVDMGESSLPIVVDALGGADGIIGTDGMSNRRILVDFRNDLITITRSHNQSAPAGFRTIPFQMLAGHLLAIDAWVGSIPVKAVVDTGGQVTIANLALRRALERQARELAARQRIEDVTKQIQYGDAAHSPPIMLGVAASGGGMVAGGIEIRNDSITFGDMHIFEYWHLTREPVMLLGMDTLGLLDTLIIDYRRHELQLRTRSVDDES
jgi:hypothetical protein